MSLRGRSLKGALVWLVGGFVLFASGAALAGDYHLGRTLICNDCHNMHYSQARGWGGGPFVWPPLWPGGPWPWLLRGPTIQTCLACHNEQSYPVDVYGTNLSTVAVRQAGALNGTVDGLAPGTIYDNWKGHTLAATLTAPGGTWQPTNAEGLRCQDCHDQHGNNYYRNLLLRPGTADTDRPVTYATTVNDTTKDVFQLSAVPGQHYDASNIFFNEPNSQESALGNWCKGCHTNFHRGDRGHPTAEENITGPRLTRFASLSNRVKVMSPSGNWGPYGSPWVGAPDGLTPSCQSCHKSHGNKNAFGLVYMSGTGTVNEEGDSGGSDVRALCQQCHFPGD